MTWNPIKRWEPGERVTAADLNKYLRDNLLETLPAKTNNSNGGGLAITTGQNSVDFMRARHNWVYSSSFSTSATTPTPISGAVIENVEHRGSFLVFWSATMACSDGEIGQISPMVNGDYAAISRSIRIQSPYVMQVGCHAMHSGMTSPATVQLAGWTNNGNGTLTSRTQFLLVMPF